MDDENQVVKAFDEGAEDYIVKPFRIRELPVLSLVLGIAVVFVLVILITKIEISKMRGQDIAYDIRKNIT